MITAVRRGIALGLIASLVAAATAWADETITTRPPNEFASAVTTIDQGEKVTLQNIDVAGHDVTAADTGDDGKPLFRSELIAPGSSGPVAGTEYLVTGTYPFVCTVHPGMDATLEVTSAGTPVPRPQADGVSVKIRSGKLRRVVKTGKLKVRVASGAGEVALKGRARSGKRKVAFKRRTVAFDSAGTRTVALKLSRAGRKQLRNRRRAKVTVTATADHGGGHTAEDTATRTLR